MEGWEFHPGRPQPVEGEFLLAAAFAEVLPWDKGPSSGLLEKGQQGQRHSACLQKPSGKLLQGRRMRGNLPGIFGGTSQVLSLLLPPGLDIGTIGTGE